MKKPIVAIVGRPNVGKSTLFNALAGEKISIVEDTPGVTRDRIYADCSWNGRDFTVIDTGGIEMDTSSLILKQMREQAELAIEMADVIIFLTDVKLGLTDSDSSVCDLIRKSNKKSILVVNKVDSFEKYEANIYEFYSLGLGDPIPISSSNKLGLGDMLDRVIELIPEYSKKEEEDERTKIAIIGKPNVGKSTLINRLLNEDRMIVSDIAGTTRDSVDAVVKYHGTEYVFIDTAGLRRKNKIDTDIERYSIIRAVAAVERADISLLLIDAKEGVTEQDAKIAGISHERGKGLIIVVNKWDAVEKDTKTANEYIDKIRNVLSFATYAPIIFISAKSGQRINKVYEMIDAVADSLTLRIKTGVLNEIIVDAIAMNSPPTDKGKALKIYYASQVRVKPPTFVLFVNEKKLSHFSYERYIENKIREAFIFKGCPIRMIVREKKKERE